MAKDTPLDRASGLAGETIDRTKEVLADSYGRAQKQFDDVSDEVRATVESAAERVEEEFGDLWNDVRGYAKKNLGKSLAISAAVGLVFGFLLRGNLD